jgi:hypothetical protein
MSPEEHVAAIERAHREHEERLRDLLTEVAHAIVAAAQARPSPTDLERSRVRNLFVESCGALEAMVNMAKLGNDVHGTFSREVWRWGALRAKLLEMDA